VPEAGRIGEVFGASEGSGYLIGPRLMLTAWPAIPLSVPCSGWPYRLLLHTRPDLDSLIQSFSHVVKPA
jgi:hypothetical protein